MAIEIVDFPIKNGDVPLLYISSPEGNGDKWWGIDLIWNQDSSWWMNTTWYAIGSQNNHVMEIYWYM